MDGHTHSATNSYVGSSYNFTNIAVGKRVWFDYNRWLCVHNEGLVYYLIHEEIGRTSVFRSVNTDNVYVGSILASFCTTFQNSIAEDSLAKCIDTTVNGVTSKLFIPSYEQCNGGFSYFSSNANRIAYMNGQAYTWWTSSSSNASGGINMKYVYIVQSDGTVSSSTPTSNTGFRPCVAISL